MDSQKFPSSTLQLIFDAGMIARSLDALRDQKRVGIKTKYLIEQGMQEIDWVIQNQEKRLNKALIELREILNHGS